MGTDIWSYLERKNHETGDWEYITLYKKDGDAFEPIRLYDGRDYEMFNKLAAARCIWGEDDTFTPCRGVPKDMSPEVAEIYGDGDDFHSATWYDLIELRLYAKTPEAQVVEDEIYDEEGNIVETKTRNVLDGLLESINLTLDAYHIWFPNPGDVRVVMWFDS